MAVAAVDVENSRVASFAEAEEGRAFPDCSYYIPVVVAVVGESQVGMVVVVVVAAVVNGKDRVAVGLLVHRDTTPCECWTALERDCSTHHVSDFLGCFLVRLDASPEISS